MKKKYIIIGIILFILGLSGALGGWNSYSTISGGSRSFNLTTAMPGIGGDDLNIGPKDQLHVIYSSKEPEDLVVAMIHTKETFNKLTIDMSVDEMKDKAEAWNSGNSGSLIYTPEKVGWYKWSVYSTGSTFPVSLSIEQEITSKSTISPLIGFVILFIGVLFIILAIKKRATPPVPTTPLKQA